MIEFFLVILVKHSHSKVNNMPKLLLFLLLLLGSICQSQAQQLLGLAGSNYAGTHSLYLNPASIADSRLGFHLNLFTANGHASNNYFYYDGLRELPMAFFESYSEGESVYEAFDRELMRERINGKPKQYTVGTDLRLPSFMLKLSPRHSIALTTRFRTAQQATHVSEDLARVIGLGTSSPAIQNIPFASSRGNSNSQSFGEIGFTYAGVLMAKEKNFLKGGLTVKKLAGMYASHLSVNNMDYQVKADETTDSYLNVQNMDAQFGFSQREFELTKEVILNAFTGNNVQGSGWGFDLGFVYERRSNFEDYQYIGLDSIERTDHGKNKYRYRVGIALMDMGGITYSDPQQARMYTLNRKNITIGTDQFEEPNADNLNSTYEEVLNVTASEQTTSFQSGLPMALNVNIDYHLAGSLYVGAIVIQDLRGDKAISIRQNSLVAVTPRLETKGFGLAVPVSMMNNYQDLAVGAMLKLGPLTIGSDNLGGLLGVGEPFGADLYAGLSMGIKTGGSREKVEEKLRKKERREIRADKRAEKREENKAAQ